MQRVLLSVALGAAVLAPSPAHAGIVEDAVAATAHTPDELVASFDNAELPGLAPEGPGPSITGNAELDTRIRTIAETRGYERHPEPDRELVVADGFRLQPEAAAAWEAMQGAALEAGHSIRITSAYRSPVTQAGLFRSRLNGATDAAIDHVLATVAAPGYSRHHTGYTIDIRTPTHFLHNFANSDAYAWMAADNWAVAKSFGWLPSYPAGASAAGPDPEPWEFVWIGPINIICGDFDPSPETTFCDTLGSTFAADVEWLRSEGITTGCNTNRFCPTTTITRAQAATMLWRMEGEPAATSAIPFLDVPDNVYFTEAVRWMVELVITTGTSSTEFSPHVELTRDQFVTFLWRYAGRPAPAGSHQFVDVGPTSFAADAIAWAAGVRVTTGTSATKFSPVATTTRGQAAAFLHRYDLIP